MLGKLFRTPLAVAAATLFLTAAPALAGESGSSSGSLTFVKSEHVNSRVGNTLVVTRHVSGMSHAKHKGGPLDEAQFQCHMTFVIQKGKPPNHGSGYCQGIDTQGDTWAMLLTGGDSGGKWSFIEGAGRYDMIKGSGTWRHEGSADTATERYEWAGHWELKD